MQPQKLVSPNDSKDESAQEILFQNDDVEDNEEILDDVPSFEDRHKNEAGSTVNMASVVANPRIVSNNQIKMPAVETSKLGVATISRADT